MNPLDFFQGNEQPCSLCEGWTDQVLPHRHGPNFWVFPSATTPGQVYTTIVHRQIIHDEGLPDMEGTPIATYCSCQGGQDPNAARCWHATAAFAFEGAEFRKHKPYYNPTRYGQACKGNLKQQAVILWSAARQAARDQLRVENQRLIYALGRIVESLNVQLPVGLELRIECITCFGMEFPELHLHPTGDVYYDASPEDGATDPDELSDEEVEAIAQEMYSPWQRADHARAMEWARNGNGNSNGHHNLAEDW